jgi:hypothetical protein
MQRAANALDGQKLIRFSFLPKTRECIFDFDLGSTLRTAPDDSKGEQWVLLTADHRALTLRADRRYQYIRADLPHGRGLWKSAIK